MSDHGGGYVIARKTLGLTYYYTVTEDGAVGFSSDIADAHVFDDEDEAKDYVQDWRFARMKAYVTRV